MRQRDAAVGADDREFPAGEFEIDLGSFEQMGREPLSFVYHLAGREGQCGAADHHRSRAVRTHSEGHAISVAVNVLDIVRI